MKNNFIKFLIVFSTILFIIFVAGLLWLAGAREQAAAGGTFSFMMLLAFASGLSMIVLPCTLPLVFIIVPMAASKEYAKGFMMALLFGLGLTITIACYGIAMALLGHILGIKAATPLLFLIAGIAAYIFGLSELHIINVRIPFSSTILPSSLQNKGDYIKSFMLGLLLGNAGIGCPNPLFYVLLLYIAGTANIMSGALLGTIHGLGRALPVVLITILSLFGYQATNILIKNTFSIKAATAWMLIIIAAFLIPAGIFNVRGWWILAIPPYWPAILLAGLLIIGAVLAKVFTVKKEKF